MTIPILIAPLAPPLSLRLFGPLTVHVGGQPLPKMRSKKELWLLALLALHSDAPLERSWLAGTLWPEADDEAARYNLRRSLRLLREALGPEAARILAPTPRSLRLNLEEADCDLAAFDAAVRRGDPASLREAAAFYRDPLLLDCREEWVYAEREKREQAVLSALEALAADAQSRGVQAEAASYLKRVLALDPLCETAVRTLMKVHAAQGSHAAATNTYHAFRRRLHGELSAAPDPVTVALHHRLRAAVRQAGSPAAAPTPAAIPAGRSSSLPHSSSFLPVPLTALVGRERETESVVALLDGARLVTLTGTGGVGKTQLALAAARHLEEEFEQGAWFADLAPLADPKLMVQAVLGALGAQEAAGRSPSEALTEFLRPKRLLLVLDNCEHLVSACSHLAQALLPLCPGLHVLATSREALGVPGEVVWRVPSLLVSGPDAEAAQLFLARAQSVRPGWTPSGPETHTITEICRRLDGIPLAIEMAAARTRSLPVESIIARLGQAFRLLSGPGGAGSVPRQQTLRATLDWSWDLLPDWEKTLLSRVSAFSGGWTLNAAEAVCGDDGADGWAVLDGLTGLVDKSLVVYAQEDGEARYRLLETIRQYACEKRQPGEKTKARHAAHFLALAEEAEPELMKERQAEWLTRLETEHDNLRAALAWSLAEPDDTKTGLRLAGALERFWVVRGYLFEGRQWLDGLLKRESSGFPSPARAKALNCLGNLAYHLGEQEVSSAAHQESLDIRRLLGDKLGAARSLNNLSNASWARGDFAAARLLYEECLMLRRELEDQQGIAGVLDNLGNIACALGEYSSSCALHEESLMIHRRLGHPRGMADSLQNLSNVAQAQGDYEKAKTLAEESLSIRRLLKDKPGIAGALNNLGNAAQSQADYEAATAWYRESLAIRQELGDVQGIAYSLHNLGVSAARRGKHADARTMHEESLILMRQLHDKYGGVHSLEGIADVAEGFHRFHRTACLLGAAAALRAALGSPVMPDDQPRHDKSVAAARAALGADAFAAAWAAGQEMDWEQAADYALGDGD